ncbi:MAG: transporter [Micavibrio aeruginosavorus]|uniref:Probable queuosine precursor transporter n=1 Tax=Micavibrio aeruginosavorus TaxID=349221 RepID=A0A2W5MXK2_9BACT|nr:MAG: transporter [Micavibrio aeruginosavorus]
MRQYKYLIPITGLFTATLLISNTLASKIFLLGPFTLSAGIIVFPLAYLFGDILTEVYGYAASRKVIWSGFAALALMSLCYAAAVAIPPAPFYENQQGFAATLGMVPRICLASAIAYFCGEFVNSYIVAKMKMAMQGKQMGVRFVVSTMFGECVDTIVFYAIAFIGVFGGKELLMMGVAGWTAKVAWEIIALPLTLFVVKTLKKVEHEDYYDTNTNFNPFRVG